MVIFFPRKLFKKLLKSQISKTFLNLVEVQYQHTFCYHTYLKYIQCDFSCETNHAVTIHVNKEHEVAEFSNKRSANLALIHKFRSRSKTQYLGIV